MTSLASEFPAKVVGILGMHRSGTSCLTGSLEESGLYLAKIHEWNQYNQKGNRENQDFVDLHDDILAANGGSWDNPPSRVIWRDEHRARARALLGEHSAEAVFGFKDPRTLLVLEGWHSLLPDMVRVGIFRHPNAVARSLENRSAKPREDSLALWYAYNKLLLQEYRKSPFPILNFDDDEVEFDRKVLRVAGELGLSGRQGQEKFYTEDLRHNTLSNRPRLPWRIGRLYRQLKRISV